MRATLGGAMDRVLGVSIGSHRHDPEREGGRNSDCEWRRKGSKAVTPRDARDAACMPKNPHKRKITNQHRLTLQ